MTEAWILLICESTLGCQVFVRLCPTLLTSVRPSVSASLPSMDFPAAFLKRPHSVTGASLKRHGTLRSVGRGGFRGQFFFALRTTRGALICIGPNGKMGNGAIWQTTPERKKSSTQETRGWRLGWGPDHPPPNKNTAGSEFFILHVS